ncbi:MAG: DUF2330 domain-containing protein [Myxococcales bacterium]|nr:DUF2330 domain-containing protein [Myxococcales bacterium]MCB9535719.1 DUF2330 domain-containing protein [Myxococcales bacterium]
MRHLLGLLAAALVAAAPAAALACGGLFCNNAQPVNQAAERILFARDGDRTVMHVRLTWDGPPTEFGWLLPVPDDVEVGLSSEQLFTELDRLYAPIFTLTTEFEERCEFLARDASSGDAGAAGFPGAGDGGGGVQVLSRQAIGPFDTSVIKADDVVPLRQWLESNGYGIPEGTDALLVPYVEAGAAFVALRLLPDAESREVQPIRLTFTSDQPTVPIRPTAVAAEPDMGVIVHVLGQHRAIPENFLHVRINEAAIDWPGGGQNYPDVVSQAADEAGGQAFATDYAGGSNGLRGNLTIYDAPFIEQVRAARTFQQLEEILFRFQGDADMARVLPGVISGPDGFDPVDFLACPWCYDNERNAITVDGAALAMQIEEAINPPREDLLRLIGQHPYLTRLYSTLSSHEMTQDPLFAENPDLVPVSNQYNATQYIRCGSDGEPDFAGATIETASGLRFRLANGANPNVIQRQAGETVRGEGVPAARVIEQHLVAGQPMVQSDRTAEIADSMAGDDSGCDCDAADGSSPAAALALLAVLGLVRRRR